MQQKAEVVTTLDVELTKDEVQSKMVQLCQAITELEEKENEYYAVKKEWNQELKSIKQRVKDFSKQAIEGVQERDVECQQVWCDATKCTWYVYNGRKYGERPLNNQELEEIKQKGLFHDGPLSRAPDVHAVHSA